MLDAWSVRSVPEWLLLCLVLGTALGGPSPRRRETGEYLARRRLHRLPYERRRTLFLRWRRALKSPFEVLRHEHNPASEGYRTLDEADFVRAIR